VVPAGLDLCVFDFGVNAGPVRAAKYLQMMVGAIVDGKIGPNTLGKVKSYVKVHGERHSVERYQDMREAYYKRLKAFPTFGRGWLRRVEEVRDTALEMAK
jgi:lysozyme family protein